MVVSVWSTSYKKLTLFAFYNTPDRHTWVKSKHIAAKPYKMCPWIENNDNRPWAGQRQRSDLLMILLSNALSWPPCPFFSNRRAGLGGFLVNACLSRILKVRKTLLDWRLKGVTGNYEQSDSSPISVQTNLRLMSRDLWNLSSNDSENLNSHMNLLILFGKCPIPVMEHNCDETSILWPHSG